MRKSVLPGMSSLACAVALILLAGGCMGKGGGEKPESAEEKLSTEGTGEDIAQGTDPEADWYTPQTLEEGTVAVVDGMKISSDEFRQAIAAAAFRATQGTLEGRLEILRGRVDSLLAQKAAIEAGYLERPRVKRTLERLRRRYNVWPARNTILEKVTVSDAEVEEVFDAPGDILDLTVLLAESREAAEAALERVKGGEPFEEVALDVTISPGALASNVRRTGLTRGTGMYPPEVEDAVFALAEGEISAPLETPVGYLIARLDGRRSLDESQVGKMRAAAREGLLGKKRNKALKEKIAELREGAEITVLRERFAGDDLPPPEGEISEIWRSLEAMEVAEVQGVVLTMGDILRNMDDYRRMLGKKEQAQQDTYRMLLDQQADEVLFYELGRELGIADHPRIDEAIASATIGLLVSEFATDIAMEVGEEDLNMDRCRGFFEERRDYYLDAERLSLSEILVRREADATELMDRLARGEDFAALAREYSVDEYAASGGDMGTIRREDSATIFGEEGAEELVRRGRQGDVENVLLRTTSGYHIVRVRKLQEIGEGSFEEETVRSRVLPDFLSFCRTEAITAVRDRLRSEADIVVDLAKVENLEPPPGPPPGFHGGSISVPDSSSPHGGGRPAGHP